jgi:hypothetical protein
VCVCVCVCVCVHVSVGGDGKTERGLDPRKDTSLPAQKAVGLHSTLFKDGGCKHGALCPHPQSPKKVTTGGWSLPEGGYIGPILPQLGLLKFPMAQVQGSPPPCIFMDAQLHTSVCSSAHLSLSVCTKYLPGPVPHFIDNKITSQRQEGFPQVASFLGQRLTCGEETIQGETLHEDP